MDNFNNFSKSSRETLYILLESEKFKTYILKFDNKSLTINEIFKNNNFTLFGAEIFQFWLQAKKYDIIEKQAFVDYAKEISIPVINHDKEDLSCFGEDLFSIWSESIKQKMLK